MRIRASNPWRATHFLVFIALVVSLLALAPQPPAKAISIPCAEGGTCLVGDVGPGGGIVFYVGASTINVATGISTGGRYLEAAPAGFTSQTYSWCNGPNNGNTTLIGANSASLGAGASNTATMVEKCSSGAGNVAATYSKNGYSDWFLPSTAELQYLNSQKVAIGLNLNGIYWGSNETLTFAAAALVTVNNAVGDLNKEELTTLWPIRAFNPSDPLPAPRVAITQASSGTARRTAFTTQPQIIIQDVNRNTVTSSSAVVTATVSGGGTLIGTTTATASSGLATFSNLGVDGTVGSTYTITYSAEGLTSATATVTLSGTTCDGTTFTCQVGDIGPGGGKIFYVASGFFTQLGATAGMCTTNCKYLEAAPTTGTANWTDNNYAWSGNANTLIGASAQGTAIGTGYQNTLAIVGQSGAGTLGAASVVRSYTGPNGKTDWFLPSKDELHQMRLQRSFVAAPPVGAPHSNYWSSTESSSTEAIYEYFPYDNHYQAYDKSHDNGIFARPVRAFGPATYTVTFNTQGGSAVSSQSWSTGTTLTLPPAPTQSGYTFNGWFDEASGGTQVGIASNAANGLAFDGVNDRITIPHSTSFNFTESATVEAWINTTSSNIEYITTKGEDSFFLATNVTGDGGNGANSVSLWFQGPSISAWLHAGTLVNDGKWHHVAGTYDGSTLKIYVDGELRESRAASGPIGSGSSEVQIGSRNDGGYFTGKIYDVRYWNVARSADQISSSKNARPSGSESGLIAAYSLNQGTAGGTNAGVTTATNSKSGAAVGTLSGFDLTGATSNWVQVLGTYAPEDHSGFTLFAQWTANPGAPAPVVVYVPPAPVPYLRTLTSPRINLKDGKLVCTPGTYNAGYTLDGVIQESTTTLFTPSTITYNLLINGVAQTSLAVTSSITSNSWNMPAATSGSLITCSVTVAANGVTNTDKSTDNTAAVSSALSTQTAAASAAEAAYVATKDANSKAYQKALVDNRAQWRKEITAIRANYYEVLARINAESSSRKMISDKSTALKIMIAAQKKSAADYKASQPAALAAKGAADKTALDTKTAAIAKANATYGTFIESIGYGVLIP
jgi:uncharacterized repeat protein (TIGR02543 family)